MAGAGEGRGQEVDRDLRKRGVREEEGEVGVNFDGGVFVGWIENGEIYLGEGMCVEEVGCVAQGKHDGCVALSHQRGGDQPEPVVRCMHHEISLPTRGAIADRCKPDWQVVHRLR
jgi:hypothetical protein